MNRVLRFKPHLGVELAGDGLVFLLGDEQRFLLNGRTYERVVPLIDGQRTEQQIIDALAGQVTAPEVLYVLLQLEQQGHLVEAAPELAPEAAALWYALGVDARAAARALASTPVAITALDDEDPGPLAEALAGAGVTLDAHSTLRVVLVRDYLDPALEALHDRALAEGLAWMPIKLAGARPWMGPVFAGQGPCWVCLASRLRDNRPVERFLARRTGREPRRQSPALTPASARAAASLAALALARWIADGKHGLLGHTLLTLDIARMHMEEHRVVRRPQCPACGDPELLARRAEQPVVLEPRPTRFADDGGHRSITPEETYARHQHLVSPITGVVSRVAPVPGRDHPLRPVYSAPFLVCPPDDRPLRSDEFTRVGLGKGRTPAQARAGALAEAIERYSAAFQGDEKLVRARMSELGPGALPPHTLLRFSEAQYRRRDELNGNEHDDRRRIPLPFDEDVAIDWAPAWSLTHEERRYLPASLCYLHLPAPPEERFCHLDPNGHAAGNCLEEAILQGFLELAERDAVGIWWYNRVARPAVDLASFAQPYFTALEQHYRSMGYRLWVLDVTNDLEIPVFVALAQSKSADRYHIGFGCHLDARLGVQRALTELNQIFDMTRPSPAPWGDAPLDDAAFLLPDERAPARQRADFATIRHEDLRDDVRACVARAARLGLDTIVLDQTRPDVGLHAVKVVVPGLRHFWPRLGPGRLYDVPVRLGWLDRPRAEAELNPVPLYL